MSQEILEDALLFVSMFVPLGTCIEELLNGGKESFNPSDKKVSDCLSNYAKLLSKVDPYHLPASRPMTVASQLALLYIQKSETHIPGAEVFILLKSLHNVQKQLGDQLEPYATMTSLLEKRITT